MYRKDVRHIQEKFNSISVKDFKRAKLFLNHFDEDFNKIKAKFDLFDVMMDLSVVLDFKDMRGSIAFIRKSQDRYVFDLDIVKCNYGWYRYYFVCPMTDKRVEKLFLINWKFATRYQYNLTYLSTKEDKTQRLFASMFGRTGKSYELWKTIKYTHRNGKPTRKYKAFLRLWWFWNGMTINMLSNWFSSTDL